MLRKIFFLVVSCQLLLFNCFAKDIKEPNVAGSFYPKGPAALSQLIDNFFINTDTPILEADIVALISPHAGYEYSGKVAAYGYRAIQNKEYQTIIIIAPSHHFGFEGAAIWPKGAFKTPLGEIEIDEQFSAKLMQLNPNVKDIPEAFEKEHSLEVQLPFLQETLKNFKIVALLMGNFDYATCELLSHSLSLLSRDKKCLVIASTDLSHYHSYQQANKIDEFTLSFIKNLDAKNLYQQAESRKTEACGLGPVLTCLLYAKELDTDKPIILKYANSGDVTGERSRVVGYASVVFLKEGEKKMLNREQRKKLLEIARQSIETHLRSGKKLEISESDPNLKTNSGAFVTLHKHGELRGCIGNLLGQQPLYLTVRDMAVEAAVDDPRFSPLTLQELQDIEIEISALSPLKRIESVDEIKMGIHGVLIRGGFNSGVFLPQVATETGWSKEEFLSNLCSHKAGLPALAWKDKTTEIYIFSAEVFSEESYY